MVLLCLLDFGKCNANVSHSRYLLDDSKVILLTVRKTLLMLLDCINDRWKRCQDRCFGTVTRLPPHAGLGTLVMICNT